MKYLLSLGFIGGAVVNLLAADPQDNKPLRGDWIPIKAELGGKPVPDNVLKTITMNLGDGTYHVLAAGEPDKGTYEIDPTANPKGMLIRGTEGPNKGLIIPAIYEVNAKTLRICYDLSGAQRPNEFKSVAGTRLYLVTYQRKE